jgi:hypothetical protein
LAAADRDHQGRRLAGGLARSVASTALVPGLAAGAAPDPDGWEWDLGCGAGDGTAAGEGAGWLAGLPADVRSEVEAGPWAGDGEALAAGFLHHVPRPPATAACQAAELRRADPKLPKRDNSLRAGRLFTSSGLAKRDVLRVSRPEAVKRRCTPAGQHTG